MSEKRTEKEIITKALPDIFKGKKIDIPQELYDRLEAEAKSYHLSVSSYFEKYYLQHFLKEKRI